MKWIQAQWEMVRGYHRNVKLFMLATVFLQIGLGMFLVIYNFYVRELGFDDGVNGRVISMLSLATALFLIPGGLISDRAGRKRVMVVGGTVATVTMVFRSLVASEPLLLAGAFATGMFVALLQVSGVPFLAENATKRERVTLFSLYFSLMTASQVIGSVLGGGATDFFQYVLTFSLLESVRYALLLGCVSMAAGLVPLLRLSEGKREAAAKIEMPKAERKKNVRLIVLFSIAQILIGFGSGLVIPYLNLYFADRFDASATTIGLIISGGQAVTAVAILIGPAVVSRLGEVKALVVLQLLSLPFLFITAFTESLIVATVAFLLRQALMNAGNPIQTGLMMEMIGDRYKGVANSVNQTVFQLGWATMGPVSTGMVLAYGSYTGYAAVFSITAGLYFISSVYFFITFTWLRKKRTVSF